MLTVSKTVLFTTYRLNRHKESRDSRGMTCSGTYALTELMICA